VRDLLKTECVWSGERFLPESDAAIDRRGPNEAVPDSFHGIFELPCWCIYVI
jgi:hypothetical protein